MTNQHQTNDNTCANAYDTTYDTSYNDSAITNDSANSHFWDIASARLLSRRTALTGGLALAASMAAGTTFAKEESLQANSDKAARASMPALKLGFNAVAKNLNDIVTVPEGYKVSILHALGDPLQFGDASWNDDGSETAESYQRRIGDGHDGMSFFGLSDKGLYMANRSDRGLLCVNHEYVVAPYVLHANGKKKGAARPAPEVDKEINAHGVSVVEVKRAADNSMQLVRGSKFNRRITSDSMMQFSGPAAGSQLLATLFSANGQLTQGTNNNCANGQTPWGTYLTCEENYLNVISRSAGDDAKREPHEVKALNRYGLPQGRKSPYQWDSVEGKAGESDAYTRWNSAVTQKRAADDYRNTINTFGWVVEIDPFNPASTAMKRTALGRFNHEGAWVAPAVSGQAIVIYMGDDARFEYIYKFVSKALWTPADAALGMAAGRKYLDEGTLYVARFNADGVGEWLELSYGKNNLTSLNALYPFGSQADVVTYARLAADSVGATKMDRPEWGGVNPRNGEVYMTLTNNPARTPENVDAANPRSYTDMKDGKVQKGNVNGHIIRWKESAHQSATSFKWDIYLFGAEAAADKAINRSGLTDDNDFSSPDGLHFDTRGLLWIETDDSAYTDVTNCMLLAAVPGTVGDGTLPSATTLRRFLVGPKECEITGIALTPDHKTLFFNVQHPGEESVPNFSSASFGSYWPDSQTNPKSMKRPRSATVVITRADGGAIGV